MRAPLVVLLALLAAGLPVADAQAPLGMTASLSATPPDRAVAPLLEVARVPLRLTVTCSASTLGPEGALALFHLAQVPPWAQASVEPAEVRLDGRDCAGREAVVETLVEIRVSDAAPAFEPAPIEVEATVQAPLSEPVRAQTRFAVTAGYFSVLEVSREREILAPDGDGSARVALRVLNLGNGVTRIAFEVGDAAADLAIAPPRPLILGARHDGGVGSRGEVVVQVQRTAAGEFPSAFSLRYRSTYALDPEVLGEQGEMAFQVLPAPGMDDRSALETLAGDDRTQRDLPFGALLLVATALGTAAFARKR